MIWNIILTFIGCTLYISYNKLSLLNEFFLFYKTKKKKRKLYSILTKYFIEKQRKLSLLFEIHFVYPHIYIIYLHKSIFFFFCEDPNSMMCFWESSYYNLVKRLTIEYICIDYSFLRESHFQDACFRPYFLRLIFWRMSSDKQFRISLWYV